MPYGRRRNLNLPSGVLNVHSGELSSSSLICQKLDQASSLLNHLAPANGAMISSLVGNLKCSLLITLFRSLGSRHVLKAPIFFCTTSELTHSIGSLIFLMTPSFFQLFSQCKWNFSARMHHRSQTFIYMYFM